MPSGVWNCPFALPMLPHWRRKVPLPVNFSMRWLPLSATKMFPLRSTATASGSKNWPSPPPWLPNFARKVPHGAVAAGVAVGVWVAVDAAVDSGVSVGVAAPITRVGLLVGGAGQPLNAADTALMMQSMVTEPVA